MGFFSSIKKLFSGTAESEGVTEAPIQTTEHIEATEKEHVFEPEPAQPEQAQPEQAQPEQAQPEQAQPEQAQPEQAQPEQAQPEQAQPEQAQPEQAQPEQAQPEQAVLPLMTEDTPVLNDEQTAMLLRLREAEPRMSVWLGIVLDGVETVGDALWNRVRFLLSALEAPPDEIERFIKDISSWVDLMEYTSLSDFRSELQYRLVLALDLEDEEDERNRLFLKLNTGLTKTREQLGRGLAVLFAEHTELNSAFWDELLELFIMADMGVDVATELCTRLKERARKDNVTEPSKMRDVLAEELSDVFRVQRRVTAVNKPEIVLMVGVNGAGKTTTIAKLAYRERSRGKVVMLAAGDTFRAAAVEQLEIWATRTGSLFHAKNANADPSAVAWEAIDRALNEQVDTLFIDTAGRLQTKTNLMEELKKIRATLARKHPGAPHRTVLVLDATTGQNALSQAKLFNEATPIDEIILTKLDGTAKGGVAVAVAVRHGIPISFVGLGEKMEDLRPFNGDDYAAALLHNK